MKPVTQSRVGKDGTCFRSCIASILELPEARVPDWPLANQDPGVDRFLRGRGLRYMEVPIDVAEQAVKPVGYQIITGLSPRGGAHAVVGKDGRLAWDPHPRDGTGRGLVREENYGLLLPVAGALVADTHWEPSDVIRRWKAYNEPPYKPGDSIHLKNGKRAVVSKVTSAVDLFGEKEWHVSTTSGDVVIVPLKGK